MDDYDSINNCDANGQQPYGTCPPWDDHGHGTAMAGLVGENDNAIGYVGVAPQALTISMKIALNTNITGASCDGGNWPATFCIEGDDFYWGVRWASANTDTRVKVLSMSFSATGFNSSVSNALYDAYHLYDVLLLSNTGNPGDPSNWIYPQAWSFVMGIGGLNSDGSNYGSDAYEEVSAFAGGGTTLASCPSAHEFCTPGTYGSMGGTSSSTAIAAGIAGLVRAYGPALSAPQTRQRLINTATGPHKKLDARAAVLNVLPLSASISGPSYVEQYVSETWSASVSGGTAPYTYRWYRDGALVSTSSSYSANTEGSDFELRLDVTDAASTTVTDYLFVTVSQCTDPQQIDCMD